MNPQSKGLPSLKTRSRSMPLINTFNNSAHIHKFNIIKLKAQESPIQQPHKSHKIFEIQNLQDKQKQELSNKLKILAERSARKLQYKYQTIDRWKQKYVPQSSILLIKHKLSLDSHSIQPNKQDKKSPKQQNQLNFKGFPLISEEKIGQNLPDYKEQGKKLQQILRERLSKNKKYYQLKNMMLENQMVCFDSMNIYISPQKKRQLQLKMLLIKSQKEQALNRGLFYKKMSLEPLSLKKQKSKKKYIKRLLPKQSIDLKYNCPDRRDLKTKLMDEVLGTTPQGWDTIDQLQSPQQQCLL